MSPRRVVVTGCGAITAMGPDATALWNGFVQARSSIRPVRAFHARAFPIKVAAEVDEMPKGMERIPRPLALAYAAAAEAATQAKLSSLPAAARCGVFAGGVADFSDLEIRNLVGAYCGETSNSRQPELLLRHARLRLDATATLVARHIGIADRPCLTQVIDNACASGGVAIGEGFRKVRAGELSVAIAVCATSWTNLVGLTLYHLLGALSPQPNPAGPFDARRSGFVMGEAGAAVVLESLEHAQARGVEPLAAITGYASTANAYRITDMPPDGAPLSRVMELALLDARRRPEEVEYINAHGTATVLNDAAETHAIKRLFGERAKRIPISSTKSMIGHTITAAGILDAIACIYATSRGVIPPTVNLRNRDAECDLDYVPNEARGHSPFVTLSNSFGFGGHNCALVIEGHAT